MACVVFGRSTTTDELLVDAAEVFILFGLTMDEIDTEINERREVTL